MASYPSTRLRRQRAHAWSRAMVAETRPSPSDLIWPLFVCEGDAAQPVATMPGVSRHPVSALPDLAKQAADLGIPCVALFPTRPHRCARTAARKR
jgi:porphobilinogen synthase